MEKYNLRIFRRFKEFVDATAEQPVSVQQPQNLEQLVSAAYAADQGAHNGGDFSNDARTMQFLRQLDPTALNSLSAQVKDELITMLVHVIDTETLHPQGIQQLSALDKLIQTVWNWRTELAGGHVGNTILNRISARIQEQLNSPFFVNFERNAQPDLIAYYTGDEKTPTKLGNPKSFSGMSALFGQVKQDYRFASQTQQPTTPNATGLQQPSTNKTQPMLKPNTGELPTNQLRAGQMTSN